MSDSSLSSLKILGIVISGDVATTGLDVASVKWVLSNEIPPSLLYFYQRMGRTGRSPDATHDTDVFDIRLTWSGYSFLFKRMRHFF